MSETMPWAAMEFGIHCLHCTELFGFFWNLSIVWYVEVHKRPQRFGDWICLRPQVDGAE
jgi:hypothetical protein